MKDIPLIGIAAHCSGAGKTQLILGLLEEFLRRSVKAAVLKHGQHVSWPEDKDSGLYMRHGAKAALLVAPAGRQLLIASAEEANFFAARDLLCRSATADIILVEGYKLGPQPKLLLTEECLAEEQLLPHTVAIVSDREQHSSLPCFSCADTTDIAGFIMSYCGIGGE